MAASTASRAVCTAEATTSAVCPALDSYTGEDRTGPVQPPTSSITATTQDRRMAPGAYPEREARKPSTRPPAGLDGDVDERGAVGAGAGQDGLGVVPRDLTEVAFGLDDQGEEADVAGGGDARHLLMGEGPGDGGGDAVL